MTTRSPSPSGVHVHLVGVLQEAVDQDRVLGRGLDRLAHEALEVGRVVHDGHGPAAEHVAGPDQDRIADARRHCLGVVEGGGRAALRLGDPELVQERAEALAVLGEVHRVGARTQDLHPRPVERNRQPQRRLPAELDHHPFRLLLLEDVHHVLEGQGLEVEAVGGVVVGRDRLRVAVDHDGLVARLLEGEAGVAAAVVELDALADAVGAAAQDDDLLPGRGLGLVLALVGGVEVGGVGDELGGARVHAFVDGHDARGLAPGPHVGLGASWRAGRGARRRSPCAWPGAGGPASSSNPGPSRFSRSTICCIWSRNQGSIPVMRWISSWVHPGRARA